MRLFLHIERNTPEARLCAFRFSSRLCVKCIFRVIMFRAKAQNNTEGGKKEK